MRRLAVLSMHTSPLAQPGTGDGGGHERLRAGALLGARPQRGHLRRLHEALVTASSPTSSLSSRASLVHHVAAGPPAAVAKETLQEHVEEFTESVVERMTGPALRPPGLSGLRRRGRPRRRHPRQLLALGPRRSCDQAPARAAPRLDVPHPRPREGRGEPGGGRERRAGPAGAAPSRRSSAARTPCSPRATSRSTSWSSFTGRTRAGSRSSRSVSTTPSSRPATARTRAGRSDSPATGRCFSSSGRIQPLKGADVALQAFALPLAVGSGRPPRGRRRPERSEGRGRRWRSCARMVEDFGLGDRVRFVPPQPHELLSTYYRAADCCLVPSRSESFGLVALEAAACGTPVVAAAVGGLTTLVQHGRTGYLVEDGDAAAYAKLRRRDLRRPPAAGRARGGRRGDGRGLHLVDHRRPPCTTSTAHLTSRTLVEC